VKTRLLLVAAAVAVCAAAFSASAGAEGKLYSGYLKTPSGSVYCDYLYGSHIVAKYRYVRCGFKGKLSPQEPKPKGGCPKDTDYVGNRMQVMLKGRGEKEPCAGDAGPFGNPKAAVAVPYGHTWRGGPFSCTSFKQGMTCKSADGHGFRLAKRGWRVF
jgi:hypothetical protein